MKKLFILILASCFILSEAKPQTIAQKRAVAIGLGMNLSHLEGYWDGTKANHFGDFVKMTEVMKRKQMTKDIAKSGFKTVRIPICYSAFASLSAPYNWDFPQGVAAADSMIRWVLENNMKVMIDFHHPEYDGSVPGANTIGRKVAIWKRIAEKYKNTDPEKVFFELQNEPHDVSAAVWRDEANQLITAVRAIAPNHTMIIGFHDYNGRTAMIGSEPFADPNIIYTFHFYDPFTFTHQGASWVNEMKDVKFLPFPADWKTVVNVPASAKGTWVEGALKAYANDATNEVIYNSLFQAKEWAKKKNVPIFMGEFGSYGSFTDSDSRCRHANILYQSLGLLEITSAWWEWDGGFNMFKKGTTNQLSDCMIQSLESYSLKALGINEVSELQDVTVYPNPSVDTFTVQSTTQSIALVELVDLTGRVIKKQELLNGKFDVLQQPNGVYIMKLFDAKGKLLGYKKIMKQ